jgi:hypothetical protein
MKYLNAGYGFKLRPYQNKTTFIFEPIFKVGNIQELNDLFDSDRVVKLKKVGPVEEMNEYIVCPLEYTVAGIQKRLVFETTTFLHPYGIIRIIDNQNDCFLFRVVEDHTYEIFISKGNYSQSAQLFSMFVEGLLNDDIDEIYEIGFLS